MVSKVTSSPVPHGLARIGELSRTSKIALVALGILALRLVALAIRKTFCSGQAGSGVAAEPDKRINVYADISGNPTHLGHMHMIGLAVNRLVKEGYLINQVKVELGSEGYLQEKVPRWNAQIQKDNNSPENTPKMLIVPIPLEDRIVFLRAAIQEAKEKGFLEKSLHIDYSDRQDSQWKYELPFFQVCGVDFAETGGLENVQHAIVVTRDKEPPQWLVDEACRGDNRRFIVRNEAETSGHSSSRIQNGDYELLPESVRDRFIELHQAAQPKA
ncbi:MAG: hypothetical protein ABSA17_08695 [Rhabdochlamydiaceae bacterium]|jgi:hypothetical protein